MGVRERNGDEVAGWYSRLQGASQEQGSQGQPEAPEGLDESRKIIEAFIYCLNRNPELLLCSVARLLA